jgi:hypothetical protein
MPTNGEMTGMSRVRSAAATDLALRHRVEHEHRPW